MARNYAALPHDYLVEMELLSDAEFGRLMRALLQYSIDGAVPSLSGNERTHWPRIKMQEDRFQSSYDAQLQSRIDAGRLGAAKRWGKTKESEASQGIAADSNAIATHDGNSEASQGVASLNGDSSAWQKCQTETKYNNISCGGGSGDSACARDSAFARLVSYYSQKVNSCFGHAESDGLVEAYQAFGADVVIYAIDNALAANKPSWTYIRAIIKRWERQGVKTLADAKRLDADFEAQKQVKQTAARQQRSSAKSKKTSFAEMAKQAMQQEKQQGDIIEADWSEVQ